MRRLVAGGRADGFGLAVAAAYPLLFWRDDRDAAAGAAGEPSLHEEAAAAAEDEENDDEEGEEGGEGGERRGSGSVASGASGRSGVRGGPLLGAAAARAASVPTTVRERAVYIPLRLSYEDRKVPECGGRRDSTVGLILLPRSLRNSLSPDFGPNLSPKP
jgi:hypothetical protein